MQALKPQFKDLGLLKSTYGPQLELPYDVCLHGGFTSSALQTMREPFSSWASSLTVQMFGALKGTTPRSSKLFFQGHYWLELLLYQSSLKFHSQVQKSQRVGFDKDSLKIFGRLHGPFSLIAKTSPVESE